MQERSHTAEAKLQATTTQLEELQVKQRQLEARNLLLEKVARLNKQTVLREAHEPVPLPWEVHSKAYLPSLVTLSSHYTMQTCETSNTCAFLVSLSVYLAVCSDLKANITARHCVLALQHAAQVSAGISVMILGSLLRPN